MNLFTKIAKEKDSNTAANVGLGAATIGGLGAGGYGAYNYGKGKLKENRAKAGLSKKEQQLLNTRAKAELLDQVHPFASDKEYLKALKSGKFDKGMFGGFFNSAENAKKQKFLDTASHITAEDNRRMKHVAKYQQALENLAESVGKNKKIGLAGLGITGLGTAGLAYNN